MVSKWRLKKPCPCGSGKRYGDCCALQNKKRRRRRRSGDSGGGDNSGSGSEQGPPARGAEATPGSLSPAFRRFLEQFEDFGERFPTLFNATNDVLIDTWDQPVNAMVHRLEVPPEGEQLENAQYMLLYTWMLVTDFDGLEVSRRELIEGTESFDVDEVADLLEILDDARLGAWRLELVDEQLAAVPMDGNPDSEPIELRVALDNQFSEVEPENIYAGWVAELEAGHFMFFARPCSKRGLKTLQKAVERSAWSGGDSFRHSDYQEDILALSLNEDVGHLESSEGRTMIDPHVFADRHALRTRYLEMTVDEEFYEGESYSPFWGRRQRRELENWTQQGAEAVGELFEEFRDNLRGVLHSVAGWMPGYFYPGHRTVDALVSDEQLLAPLQLKADGSVDHPATTRRNQYPVTVLDVDDELLKKAGIPREWSIDHALRWARANLEGPRLIRLENAAEHHHIAMRWVGIVARYRQADDPIIPRITYRDIRSGIAFVLPSWAVQTPVEKLEDPGHGTWIRVSKAMREAGDLDPDEPLVIDDLPATVSGLHNYQGVSSGTSSSISEALQQYVANWPDSAGYVAISVDEESDEGRRDIESGLDELDELF